MSLALHYWMGGAHHCSGPPRLLNDLYCVECYVKLYYTIPLGVVMLLSWLLQFTVPCLISDNIWRIGGRLLHLLDTVSYISVVYNRMCTCAWVSVTPMPVKKLLVIPKGEPWTPGLTSEDRQKWLNSSWSWLVWVLLCLGFCVSCACERVEFLFVAEGLVVSKWSSLLRKWCMKNLQS